MRALQRFPRIAPFLWFDSNAEEAVQFYRAVFRNSRRLGGLEAPDGSHGPKGIVFRNNVGTFALTIAGPALAVLVVLGVVNATGFLPAARAQSTEESLRFEVASVKPAAPPAADRGDIAPFRMRGGPGSPDSGQIAYTVTLKMILLSAYGVRNYQVSGPGWLDTERYDIAAKVPAGTSSEQFHTMLRNLLKDRFHLTLHHEPRVTPVYELAVAKSGMKLKEAIETAGPPPAPGGRRTDSDGFPDYPEGAQFLTSNRRNGHILLAARASTISNLISCLEPLMDRPIVDKTGLTGEYSFKVDFLVAGLGGPWDHPEAATEAQTDGGMSIFEAFPRQLGLSLESKKDPVDHLVIDRVDEVPGEK